MVSPESAERPPSPPAPLRGAIVELGLGVAWLIGVAALLQVINTLLGRSVLGVALAGAFVVEFAATWAGVRWADGASPPWQDAARRIGRGAALAALLAVLIVGLSAAFGWARVGLGYPSASLVAAVLRAGAVGVRDELLLRGIPLTAAARAGVPKQAARGFAALTGAAAIALAPGTSPEAIALAAGSGLLFATLWQRERGAFSAVGAHSALALCIGEFARGGLVDAVFERGNLVLGPRAAGAPAWLAAGAALALALLLPRLPGFRSPRIAISPQK